MDYHKIPSMMGKELIITLRLNVHTIHPKQYMRLKKCVTKHSMLKRVCPCPLMVYSVRWIFKVWIHAHFKG